MERHCGKEQSIRSFNDGDEARTRHLDWENVVANLKVSSNCIGIFNCQSNNLINITNGQY